MDDLAVFVVPGPLTTKTEQGSWQCEDTDTSTDPRLGSLGHEKGGRSPSSLAPRIGPQTLGVGGIIPCLFIISRGEIEYETCKLKMRVSWTFFKKGISAR